jgi:DNA-binding response OmpR family regulator
MTSSDARAKVLVVDDLADLADSLTAMLRLEGFNAHAAYDGERALAMAQAFNPHCILLDIGMPGVDGLELAERLREMHGDGVILLAMTGRSANEPRVAAALRIVDHYFAKPVDLDTLLKVLAP